MANWKYLCWSIVVPFMISRLYYSRDLQDLQDRHIYRSSTHRLAMWDYWSSGKLLQSAFSIVFPVLVALSAVCWQRQSSLAGLLQLLCPQTESGLNQISCQHCWVPGSSPSSCSWESYILFCTLSRQGHRITQKLTGTQAKACDSTCEICSSKSNPNSCWKSAYRAILGDGYIDSSHPNIHQYITLISDVCVCVCDRLFHRCLGWLGRQSLVAVNRVERPPPDCATLLLVTSD